MPVLSGEDVLTSTVKDLYVNCEYYFRVKAVNKVGAGEYLELRNPVIIEEIKRKCQDQLFTSKSTEYMHNCLCFWINLQENLTILTNSKL